MQMELSNSRVLVVGGDSLIGGTLARSLRGDGVTVLATTRRRERVAADRPFVDLADEGDAWQLPDRIDVAFLCAAESKTIPCRRDPAGTARVNVEHARELASRLIARGARVVFISTNQVFSGAIAFAKVDEPVCPVSEYGRQKARAEAALLTLGDGVTVLRISKVFQRGEPLLNGWADRLRAGEVIQPLGDYYVAPLRLGLVVEGLKRLAGKPGLWQVSGPRDVSYGEVGVRIAECVGADRALVQPRTTAASGLELEPFGPHTTLDSTAFLRETGLELDDPMDVVEEAVG